MTALEYGEYKGWEFVETRDGVYIGIICPRCKKFFRARREDFDEEGVSRNEIACAHNRSTCGFQGKLQLKNWKWRAGA